MREVTVTLTLSEDGLIADNERLIKLDITYKSSGGGSGADTSTESDPPVEGFQFSTEPVEVEPAKDSTLNIRITDGSEVGGKDEEGRTILTPNIMISDISASGTLDGAEVTVENGVVVIKTNKQNTDRENSKKLGLITISGGGKTRRVQVVQKKDELQMEKAPLGDKDLNGVDKDGVTFKKFRDYSVALIPMKEFVINIAFKAIKMKYYKSGLVEYLAYGDKYDEYDYIYTVSKSGWFKVTDIKDHYIIFGDIISYEGQLLGRVTSSYIEFKFQSIEYSKSLNIARYKFNGVSVDTSKNYVDEMEDSFEATYWASGDSNEMEGPGVHIEGSGQSSGGSSGGGSSTSTATDELYLTININTTNTNMEAERNVQITKYI